jgi:hypothetical protein
MSLEERDGVLDQVTEKGILLSGVRLSYSKWFEGDRPTVDALGQKITVVIDRTENWQYLKRVISIGEKVPGWTPPASPSANPKGGSWMGGGRRISPEELELKRAERIQIARSVSIDRAIDLAEKGISIEKVAPQAKVIEEYLLSGKFPIGTVPSGNGRQAPEFAPEIPPPPPAPRSKGEQEEPVPAAEEKADADVPPPSRKPRRSTSQAVNALFNEARRGGLVADWKAYADLIESLPGQKGKAPYALSADELAKVEAYVRKAMAGRGATPSRVA